MALLLFLSIGAYGFLPGAAQAAKSTPSFNLIHSTPVSQVQSVVYYIPKNGLRIHYGQTYILCYPNHLMIPNHYSKRAIRDMVGLSAKLGWHTVYVYGYTHPQGMPAKLQGYANRYFADHGRNIRYIVVAPIYRYYNIHPDRHYDHHDRHNGSGIHFRFRF